MAVTAGIDLGGTAINYPMLDGDGMFLIQELFEHPARAQGGPDVWLADQGDPMCRAIFRVQAHALGLFFDQMVYVFDPDALIVGGGARETEAAFQRWFLDEIRAAMPRQREEQAGIPIQVIPNGDTAGARGAAVAAAALLSGPAA